MDAQALVLREAERAQGGVMLIDDVPGVPSQPGWATLSAAGVLPEELWSATGTAALRLAVLAKPRSSRELYRVLANAERLIAPGGAVFILPYATDTGPENRFEATEIFLGVHSGWERTLREGNAVELRRKAVVDIAKIPPAVQGDYLTQEQIQAYAAAAEPAPIASKRVISLSIFGVGTYWQYLPAYIRAHLTLFPGYELRIHHDDGLDDAGYGNTLRRLNARGLIHLIHIPARSGQGKCERMLHRFLPAWDPEVEYVFARDLDALPTWRERRATEEFLAAAGRGEVDGWTVHDNIAHCGMMGGLSGFRALALRALYPTFEAFIAAAGFDDAKWAQHGADQEFLNSKVVTGMRIFEHSVFLWIDDDGVTRRYRQPTEWAPGNPSVKFATDIAPFDDPRVPMDVRAASDRLIPYLGVAGHDHSKATAYYETCCPEIDAIHEAERAAGEVPT